MTGSPPSADPANHASTSGRLRPAVLACAGGLLAGGINGLLLLTGWPQAISVTDRQIVIDGFLHGLILALGAVAALCLIRRRWMAPMAIVVGALAGWIAALPVFAWGTLSGGDQFSKWASAGGFLRWGILFGGPVVVAAILPIGRFRGVSAILVATVACAGASLVFWCYGFTDLKPDAGLLITGALHGAVFGFLFSSGWTWGANGGLGLSLDSQILRVRSIVVGFGILVASVAGLLFAGRYAAERRSRESMDSDYFADWFRFSDDLKGRPADAETVKFISMRTGLPWISDVKFFVTVDNWWDGTLHARVECPAGQASALIQERRFEPSSPEEIRRMWFSSAVKSDRDWYKWIAPDVGKYGARVYLNKLTGDGYIEVDYPDKEGQ